ncbi:hypothetical protein FK531_20025 [Rhodococcus spelaei]|uniref:DUF7159 domain-containing protein n=1 Tax=Rhodococcus spelaei TaxID=2546320 RepID=A0A541B086_9NOCA|nr:hypothetical protein [Rhodococcus spelaei]TQF65727.1 hypothetical protein FK531_20025 [Rhodococcus spelaei]
MVLVLGVSAGASGARAVLAHSDRPHHDPLARCDVRRRPGSPIGEPVISAIRTLRATAVEQGELVSATAVTLRTGIDPEVVEFTAASTTRAHVRVLPETAAQLRYLRFTGQLPRRGAVVIYDVGGSGLSVCVADAPSGEILSSRRSAVVGGDQLDRLVQDHLAASGVRIDLTACRDLKEQLSFERVVTASDPSTGAMTVLTNNDLAALTRDGVMHSVSLLRTMIRESAASPAAVVLLGGGGHVAALRDWLETFLRLPVTVPPDPASVAGRGAVLLAAATAAGSTLRRW